MNRVELVGRVVRDPKVTEKVTSFTIALDRDSKDAGSDFPRVVAFGKTAEIIQKYFTTGRLVSVEGRIQTGSYEGKNGTVYTTDVVADRVKVLEWDKQGHSYSAATNKIEQPRQESFAELDEDVPF